MSDNLKAHGKAIQDSVKNISEAAKRDPVLKSCSPEMMKLRYGVMDYGSDMPKPLPLPYERIHKTTRWLV
ncbi:hypothetical protein [Psychrobacter sp. 1044]|uniref:hypothetical protein n=1 Tax=Psychrobacter sp. 1044 TaxID=2772562 RepID=UPI00191A21E4|nr:hypothetical protein [Psychrobacter sp. 1044]